MKTSKKRILAIVKLVGPVSVKRTFEGDKIGWTSTRFEIVELRPLNQTKGGLSKEVRHDLFMSKNYLGQWGGIQVGSFRGQNSPLATKDRDRAFALADDYAKKVQGWLDVNK